VSQHIRSFWQTSTLIYPFYSLQSDRDKIFKWFEECLTDLEASTQAKFFETHLLEVKPDHVNETCFSCFKTYFESVNIGNGSLKKAISPPVTVENLSRVAGLDFVWRLVMDAPSDDIAQLAIDYLLNMSFTLVSAKLKEDQERLHKAFIDRCFFYLENVLSQDEDVKAMDPPSALEDGLEFEASVRQQDDSPGFSNALMGISISSVSRLPSAVRGLRLKRTTRILHLAERYISAVEESSSLPRIIFPHGATFHGRKVELKVVTEDKKGDDFVMETHYNEFVGAMKTRIADALKQSADSLSFHCGQHELSAGKDRRFLCSLDGFDSEEQLTWVVKKPNASTTSTSTALVLFQDNQTSKDVDMASQSSRSSPASNDDSSRWAEAEEIERTLPGILMASGGKVFNLLYQLAGINDSAVIRSVRRLLAIIPTDPEVEETLDHEIAAASSASSSSRGRTASAADASPKFSPRRKVSAVSSRDNTGRAISVTREEESEWEGKKELKSLFDPSAPEMNPFRLLYNLEVLSSRLKPTVPDEGRATTASQDFSTRFLHCGGLSLVLGVMAGGSMPADVDYDLRQSIYLTALQLAYYLLCDQPLAAATTTSAGPMSAATATPGGSILTSPIIKPTPPKRSALDSSVKKSPVVISATRIVQTMQDKDFRETIVCLTQVARAGATGNLQLTANQAGGMTGKPEHAARFFLGARRSRDSSTGSSGSEGSSSVDMQSQQGGLASPGQSVSKGDAQIAAEALELLVTCLQMRTIFLPRFYELPKLGDFIVMTVLASPSEHVRKTARDQFIRLAKTRPPAARALNLDSVDSADSTLTPRLTLAKLLLKTPVPLWAPTASARGVSNTLLAQCTEYFDLRCSLLRQLTARDQRSLDVKATSMMEDEQTFLQNITLSHRPIECIGCTLLAGHLRLVSSLFCDVWSPSGKIRRAATIMCISHHSYES